METDSYSVIPEYTYDKNGKRVFKEYEATNSLKIVVDNVKIVGKVMDAAVEAGAMNVHSVNFGVKDRSQYSDRVLRLATQNALHKAEIMAETVGSKVIGTVSLSQSSRSVYAPVFEAEMDLKAVGMRETTPVYDKEIQKDLKRIVEYGLRDTAKGRIVDGSGENRPWQTKEHTLFRSQEELYKSYKI